MRKKIVLFAALAIALTGCKTELGNKGNDPLKLSETIGFQVGTQNTTRAQALQKAGHYNFGVFGYKSTDKVNPVMPNYLVGYNDDANGYSKPTIATTWGDQEGLVDGQSYWMYEGMGYAEYNGTYAGQAVPDAYKSNNANQYLKYWDNAAEATYFYAYAPYIHGAGTVTYVDGTAQAATGSDTYVMNFPNGTLKDGYDDASLAEYMYASVKVAKANYGLDVALNFKRLNAKVNIKFWEDVPGYKVRILNLSETYNEGVYAAASIKEAGKGDFGYKGGKFYTKNGAKIKFADGAATSIVQYEGTLAEPTVTDGNNATTLKFKAPVDAQIGENRYAASASASTYYAIPKGDGANVLADGNTDITTTQTCDADLALTGFTFHVTYELTAEDTGEKIVVKNATVHVPAAYCNWKMNTHYTYIFKITTSSNGTTEGTPTIDPTDPEVPTTQALYPIVFDNCTVEDWNTNESEWNISDEANLIYHDVQLSTYSLVSGVIDVTVTDNDTYAGHAIDYSAISLAGPDLTNVTYDNATHKITVAAGAAAGVYTVTYTCAATYDQTTHPSKWSETFVVGNAYTVTTHRDVIGTKMNGAQAKLNVTGTINGSAFTGLAEANLSIDYPENFNSADKAHVAISGTDVVVKNTAKPGVYKVVESVVVEGKTVKVAEHLFTVVDYNFTLSPIVVYNTVGGTIITASQAADANHVYTSTTGTVTGNTITVANNTAEGIYTVTYTVFEGAADETVYTKTFKVMNTHSVAVTKAAISKSVGTSSAADYSTDVTTIKTTINGVATDTDLSAKLSIVDSEKAATAAGAFKITYTSTNEYKLEVKNGTTAGDYYVKFVSTVDGADKAEYVHFVVTE